MTKAATIVGMMSGSSLDGLDVLAVHFPAQPAPQPGKLEYKVLHKATLPYSAIWYERLKQSGTLQLEALHSMHQAYGRYLGDLIQEYLSAKQLSVDYLAVHGHTVYHEPAIGFTLQLGELNHMAKASQLPIISDFRQQDIRSGGQGAPLAPIVEQWFLADYDIFLNLGGIANISYHSPKQVLGFDIGVANQLLNALAQQLGKSYDDKGQVASSGKVIPELLQEAKANPFFELGPPKSLSNQWVQEQIIPLFLEAEGSIPHKLATANSLIAWQVQHALQQIDVPKGPILVTGGGAYNDDLIQRMQALVENKIIRPEPFWIEQKEALLMALMGFLKINGLPNVIGAVTGSKIDQSCGNIYVPNQL